MWVKICGLRNADLFTLPDTDWPDAVGLNFYSPSRRSVTIAEAAELRPSIPERVETVGVFVNPTHEFLRDVLKVCQLDWLQFHGDESPDFLADAVRAFPGRKLIRAWRMKDESLRDLEGHLQQLTERDVALDAVLIDAHSDTQYGGTGQKAPWTALREAYLREAWPPLILAGGLEPENVSQGIAAVEPWGVDTASGVESAPGIKDLDATREFVAKSRSGCA